MRWPAPGRAWQQTTSTMKTLPAPDPRHGLFETLLVRGGAAVELDAHLERLARSLATLFGAELPAGLADEVREQARELALGRLRITAAAGAPARIATERVDPADLFPAPERGARLQSVRCDGGLGCHKWADRRGLDAVAGPALPLLFDRGTEVLEASRANVFVAHGQALFTPPGDSRILPGIARASVIAVATEAGIRVEQKRLSRADLLRADELFLSGSVRGVEPASSLDGEPLPEIGEIGDRVAALLRRRWEAGDLAARG